MTLFGFLNCNKPAGMTSRDVVNVVQWRLLKAKVGHAGTLDFLAEGVLVLGLGPAARLLPYVQQQSKRYRAVFRLGVSTVSGDLEGEVTEHPELPVPDRAQIDQAARGLIGEIEQTPPAHSAIWVDGKRAYKRIRAGEQFEMPKRKVRVDSIRVLRYEFPELELETVCGSGTYIRSLGIDLASAAGSIAVMSHLRRLAVGPFEYKDAVSIDQLREQDLQSMLIPPRVGVSHLMQLKIDAEQSKRLGNGLCIDGDPPTDTEAEAAALTDHGDLRAIVRWKKDAWCPRRVFPLS